MTANAIEVLDLLVVPTPGPVVLLRTAATAVTHGLLIPKMHGLQSLTSS
jgi:hypothetical protein